MNLETLQKFCHSWSSKLKTPFNNRGCTYATNGVILLRINTPIAERELSRDDFPEDVIDAQFEGPFNAVHKLSDFLSEEQKEVCKTCNGAGKITECPECEGTGEIELDSGYNFYSVECQTCGGDGHIPEAKGAEVCNICEGTGEVSVCTRVKIGSQSFDNRLLNSLIQNLPENTTIATTESSSKAAFISWVGGTGLIMPMRD